MLRFIEQRDTYSVYERKDGSEVYLAHGFPRVYLVEYDEAWMLERWHQRFDEWGSWQFHHSAFLAWLRAHVTDPDVVDYVRFCESCDHPTHDVNGYTVEGNGFACDSCVEDSYYSCSSCNVYSRNTTCTLYNEYVCNTCRTRDYSFCIECDGYYHDGDASEHDHRSNARCCESPALTFAIRNDGDGMLQNDEQVTVLLPAGTLDDEGLCRIRQHLRFEKMWQAADLVDKLDRRWQTREGNFTKRLSRTLYQATGDKIPPAVLSQVGCIAREHSTSVNFTVATTRALNMSAEDFYHEDSCWWQSYSESRCALKTNGGFGLRSFDNEGYVVSGRAWVMPLKTMAGDLAPTFDTETPDAFVVFNGYGALEGYTAARIVSHMTGMTYRKIGFTCSPMYVNGNSGYLVAPEEIATKYTDGHLNLTVSQHSNLFDAERIAAKESTNV